MNIGDAAGVGNLKLVQDLRASGADVHLRDNKGTTPLMAASLRGHAEVALYLLDHGADPTNYRGYSRAAREGHSSIVELLIKRNARIEARDQEHFTALIWAAGFSPDPKVLEILLDHGADPNSANDFGTTPPTSCGMVRQGRGSTDSCPLRRRSECPRQEWKDGARHRQLPQAFQDRRSPSLILEPLSGTFDITISP
jgi:hypothetical protein